VFGGTTQAFVTWLNYVTGNPLAMAWYLLAVTAASLVAMILMVESAPVRLTQSSDPA
jgi:hypothetical protein